LKGKFLKDDFAVTDHYGAHFKT